MSKPENPSAFPTATIDGFVAEGMSLRDYFAGQAVGIMITATSAGQHQPRIIEGEAHTLFAIARDAYAIADAMLAERSTQKADPA